MYIYAIQIIGLILFGGVCYIAWRRHELWLVLLSTVYAAFFENLDVLISRGQIGSYFYNPELILIIVETPLFIILSWGIIFYSAWILAKGLSKSFAIIALSAPLLATIIDFGMDPVAARMGLWTWVGYGPADGVMGVPLANFVGWYLVLFAFVLTVRVITHFEFLGKAGKYVIIPPIAFMVFFIFFSVFSFFATTTGISLSNQFIYFQLIFAFLAGIAIIGWLMFPGKSKIDQSHYFGLLATRLIFYIFSIYGMVIYQLWQEPVFLILIISSLVIELLANVRFKLHAKT